jgi:hypothetical protein
MNSGESLRARRPILRKRLEHELHELRGHGCSASHQPDDMLLLQFYAMSAQQAIVIRTLLGIFKFRKSSLDLVGKDMVTYLVKEHLSKRIELQLFIKNWPFQAPLIWSQDFYISQLGNWSADHCFMEIIASFRRQYRLIAECEAVFSGKMEWQKGLAALRAFDVYLLVPK